MLAAVRFAWNATRGHRLRPWRSPLLRWRVETYCGRPAEEIGALAFFAFALRERHALRRFLAWTGEMAHHRRHSLRPVQSGHAGPDPES